MKIFTLTLLFLFCAAAVVAQDTLSNPGLEQWVEKGGYTDPEPWKTLNDLTSSVGYITAKQDSTTVHSGKYSVELVTTQIFTNVAPGILSTGRISSNGNIAHGQPINSNPLFLRGWYLYTPHGTDTANGTVMLYKSGVPIDSGEIYISQGTSGWTQFAIPVSHGSSVTADTIQIVFFSGIDRTAYVGSQLWLDDLSYDFTSGISSINDLPLLVYPNPASGWLRVFPDQGTEEVQEIGIYSMDGKLVENFHAGANITGHAAFDIDLTGLQCGSYLLRVKSGARIGCQKIIVD